jgi:hypothetical protein
MYSSGLLTGKDIAAEVKPHAAAHVNTFDNIFL